MVVTFKSLNPDGISHPYQFNINYNSPTITTKSDSLSGTDDPVPPATLTMESSTQTLDASDLATSYTITNTSTNNQAATLNSISLTDATHFSITSINACLTAPLAPQATCVVNVAFKDIYADSPDGASYSSQLAVTYNTNINVTSDTDKGKITGNDKAVSLSISAPNISKLNSQIPTATYTISNNSPVTITINSVKSSDNINFPPTGCATVTLNARGTAGDSCQVSVTINPDLANATNNQSHSAYFSVIYNTSYQVTSSSVTGISKSSTAFPYIIGFTPDSVTDASGMNTTVTCDWRSILANSGSVLPGESLTDLSKVSSPLIVGYQDGNSTQSTDIVKLSYTYVDEGTIYCQAQLTFTDGYSAVINSQTIHYSN